MAQEGCASTTRHIFPFFELPRELRDEIYALALVNFPPDSYSDLQIGAEDMAPTDLLLVCRQLRHELDSLAQKCSRVFIHDGPGYDERQSGRLPPAALKAAHLRAFIYFGALEEEQMDLWSFVPESAQRMPNLQSVTLRLMTDSSSDHWGELQRELLNGLCDQLSRYCHLKVELVVVRDEVDEDHFWDPDQQRDPAMIWSDETRRLVPVSEEAPHFDIDRAPSSSKHGSSP